MFTKVLIQIFNFLDAALTARYNYTIKADDKGVEHFEIGPETITCNFNNLNAVAIHDITIATSNGNVI